MVARRRRPRAPAAPLQLAGRGALADIPLIIGTTRNEGSAFLIELPFEGGAYPLDRRSMRGVLAHFFDEGAVAEIEREYPPSSGGRPLDPMRFTRAASHALGDAMFACPARRLLRAMNSAAPRRGSAAYYYRFQRGMRGVLHSVAGDYHTSDIPYVLHHPGWYHVPPIGTWGKKDEALSLQMGSYWTSLGRGAGPEPLRETNCTDPEGRCIDWPAYTARTGDGAGDGDVNIVLDAPLSTEVGLLAEQCDMWDRVQSA